MSRSTTISGDAKQVRALLAWARSNGIGLTTVTVGSCTVHVTADPVVPAQAKSKPAKREPSKTIYAQFGGAAMSAAGINEPDEDAGEWEPVVGRR